MIVTAHIAGPLLAEALNKEVDYDTDTIKGALVTGYTFSGTDAHWSDVSSHEVTGTGYTAGGATLASKTITTVAANSWATSRANSTAYTAGQIVRPATGNGFVYQALTSGTTGSSVPTYPTTFGATVTDGGVTWECVGFAVLQLDAADLAWSSSTISATGLWVYDAQTGTASTEDLILYIDFGGTISSISGTLTDTWNSAGLINIPIN